MEKIKIAVDTDCIIALFKPEETIHEYMMRIKEMYQNGEIELYVSLKTINELSNSNYSGEPLDYAKSLSKLPNYPVGAWEDQVGTWESLEGTWNKAKENEEMQKKIHRLAKRNVKIRDRQIVIDSYLAGAQVILTNDRGLRDKGPASRLQKELGIFVITPEKFLELFSTIKEAKQIK